jgi:predicted transcriptional regulator
VIINNKEFFTVREMAEKLGRTTNTVKQQLFNKNIKPVAADAIYEASALDAIRNVRSKGRPPKAKPPDGLPK